MIRKVDVGRALPAGFPARHSCPSNPHDQRARTRVFPSIQDIKGKSGRSPSATELLSLCVLKEKVTKEKEHPAWRLPGILPGKSVSRGRAFRQGILPWRKGADIPVGSRYAACRPRLTAAQGPR